MKYAVQLLLMVVAVWLICETLGSRASRDLITQLPMAWAIIVTAAGSVVFLSTEAVCRLIRR